MIKEYENKIAHKYLIITLIPKIAFGIPIIIVGFNLGTSLPTNQDLLFTIIGVIIFLETIYYLIHFNRLKRILRLKDADSLYKTPILTSLNTGLNFIVFAPLIFLGLNYFLQIGSIGEFLKGVWHLIPIGFIELCLVYSISYLILIPHFKSFEGVKFSGLSLTKKFLFMLIPMLLFSIYIGYIITKSWVGYIYLLIPLFLIYTVIRFIKEPVDYLIEGFNKFLYANPDLSMKITVVSGDELEVLAFKYHAILQIISGIINNIKESASEVRQHALSFSTRKEKVGASREKIRNSIEEIRTEYQDIKANIESIQHHTENLSSISSELKSEMQILNEIAKKSINLSNKGEEISEEAVSMVQTGVLKMKESTENLEVLTEIFAEVKRFSSMMEVISHDTDLLALNASVEASRIGEESKGFNVIAEEIRKLSNDSAKYLEKMKENIKEMTKAVQSVVNTTNENKTIAIESKERIENTKAKLTNISESIAMIMNIIEQVPEVLKETSESIKEITAAINLIIDLTNKHVKTTKEISSLSEDQNSSIQDTEALAEDLLQLGDKMMKGIERYID